MRTCVITGASSGIGLETARSMSAMGFRVVMVSRDRARGEAARALVAGDGRSADFVQGDLSSFAGVRAVAARLRDDYEGFDVFISNAGVFNVVHRETDDGIERTFAVNHLAPFLLTQLLLDHIRDRIVITASAAHFGAPSALSMPPRGWHAYQASKLANVMFTYALARRLERSDITANCLHPGFVRTRLGSGNIVPTWLVYALLYPVTVSAREGARTPTYLATSPDVEVMSGMYFDRCAPVPSSRASYDVDAQEQLWEMSARLVGLA
jgi:NAD(P)-dependent dehydrogenase (short-subunit alcohol dehydrogenase family)